MLLRLVLRVPAGKDHISFPPVFLLLCLPLFSSCFKGIIVFLYATPDPLVCPSIGDPKQR